MVTCSFLVKSQWPFIPFEYTALINMYNICNFLYNSLPGKEHALVVCNHRSDIDWLVGWILAQVHDLISVFHASCF